MRDSVLSITKAEGNTVWTRKAMATLLLLALLASSPLLGVSLAAPQAEKSVVDSQVWRDLQTAIDHQATFVVALRVPLGQGPDAAVDGQMALEGPLQVLQRVGSIRAFTPYYGANAIVVTGSQSAVLFLVGQPNVASIGPYQGGEAWEATFWVDAIAATGQITGLVTGPDGTTPLSGITVRGYLQTGPLSWVQVGSVSTDIAGTYTIGGLPSGIYRARFLDPSGNYVGEYYDDKSSFALATNFDVTDGQTTSGIDASLAQAGKITGTVTDLSDSGPVADIIIGVWYSDGATWVLSPEGGSSNSGGQYIVGGLAAGTYRLKFDDVYTPPRYVPEYYDNKPSVDEGDDVSVTAGATTPDIDAQLGGYGSLAGTVYGEDGVTPLPDIYVDVYEPDGYGGWQWVSYDQTDGAGQYEAGGLVTWEYRVGFSDLLNPDQFAGEWYNDKATVDTGDDVHVELGAATENVNASLALTPITVTHSLANGWNLVSASLAPSNPPPTGTLESIEGSYDLIWGYDACDTADPWKLYNPLAPPFVNDLEEMTAQGGYWLDMVESASWQVSGLRSATATFALCPGWNLIGYAAGVDKAPEEVLAGLAGKYDLVYGYDAADTADPWKKYNPTGPSYANDLTAMQPGLGYWIRMTEAATLTIVSR